MTKPNVVSEAPPGVVSAANDEGVGRHRRTSKARRAACERKCSESPREFQIRTGRSGGRNRALRSHLQAGDPVAAPLRAPMPVLALKSCYPPGCSACSCGNAKPSIKLTRDLKAEMNLRTPRLRSGLSGHVACSYGNGGSPIRFESCYGKKE